MSTRISALLGMVFLLTTCNEKGKTSGNAERDTVVANDAIAPRTAVDTIVGCYAQVAASDTSLLQLESKATMITGTLSYNYSGKDRNDGTVQAEMAGDIIRGWYIFKSEGIVSIRQVAWKINKEELWPAIGQMTQRNDSAVFVQPERVRFDSTRPYKKVACVI